MERELWDLAADLAVEGVILEMGLPIAALDTDAEARGKLRVWQEDAGSLTAERIYKYMRHNPMGPGSGRICCGCFTGTVMSGGRPGGKYR